MTTAGCVGSEIRVIVIACSVSNHLEDCDVCTLPVSNPWVEGYFHFWPRSNLSLLFSHMNSGQSPEIKVRALSGVSLSHM